MRYSEHIAANGLLRIPKENIGGKVEYLDAEGVTYSNIKSLHSSLKPSAFAMKAGQIGPITPEIA